MRDSTKTGKFTDPVQRTSGRTLSCRPKPWRSNQRLHRPIALLRPAISDEERCTNLTLNPQRIWMYPRFFTYFDRDSNRYNPSSCPKRLAAEEAGLKGGVFLTVVTHKFTM
jgi:hypothetical protein